MIYQNSRYTGTPVYRQNGEVLLLSIRKRRKFNPKNFVYYTVRVGDTVDCIAFKVYHNADLWWAIMDANPQYPTEISIKPGDVLAIPAFEEVVGK